MQVAISAFENNSHREQVVRLWEQVFGYETAHNNPALAIDRKLAVKDGLFFVAVREDVVVGTIMAGYDGHRGWIYSLAVHPDYRRQRIGSRLLSYAESQLISRDCVKINLQILDGNDNAQAFYEANGYAAEKRISMGKRLLV